MKALSPLSRYFVITQHRQASVFNSSTRYAFFFFFYFTGPSGHEEDTPDFQEMTMAPSCPPYLDP